MAITTGYFVNIVHISNIQFFAVSFLCFIWYNLFFAINIVRDSRGGLPYLSPGDKNYSVPEYSRRFHQEGSTLPAINFR